VGSVEKPGGLLYKQATVNETANSITQQQTLACTYAALLLADSENEATQANLSAVLNAANCAVPGPLVDVFAQVSAFRPDFIQTLVQQAAVVAPLSAQPTSDTPLLDAPAAAPAADSTDEDADGPGLVFDDDY